MRVGIFDSGIGGLTVLKNLIKKYPQNEYVYYGDTLNLPYGNKTKKELENLASNNIDFLLEKGCEVIVIACGTVSSNCLEYLRNKYNVLIYDIISPTIAYLNKSKYQNIGIIATNRTIDSHIFKNNINKMVYEIATPDFVPLIEENKLLNIDDTIDKYLAKYKNKLDIIVLGCTHYPIIRDNIIKRTNVNTIDMGEVLDIDLIPTKSDLMIYYSRLGNNIIANTERILGNKHINIKEEK